MHRTRIKWAYYCTFRSPIAPDLGYTAQSPWVPILKPHGSINWSDYPGRGLRAEREWQRISQQSTCRYLSDDPFSDPFENGVNQRLRKLFLPGDPEDHGGARLIWAEAETAIHERDMVMFIGYSLPPDMIRSRLNSSNV